MGSPAVSIVIPAHNDEEWIARSLESCIEQTIDDIEVICVDDASTDGTRSVLDDYASRDARITVIGFDQNKSAYQARRSGIMAANAPYLLFLDGDDELAPESAQNALRRATEEDADLVGFGVDLITGEGQNPTRFERQLQPQHELLQGGDILPALFPAGEIAQGHVWRYLWSTALLRKAYEALPADLQLFRANDIPIAMLAIAYAQKYVSLSDRLYRYYFRRGVSGRRIADAEAFDFYASALDSIDAISEPLREVALSLDEPQPLLDSYASARLSTINVILRYAVEIEDPQQREDCIRTLTERVGAEDVLLAAGTFYVGALPHLAGHRNLFIQPEERPLRTVMIFTGNLGSGGVQGVVVSQAWHLQQAGYRVVVALRSVEDMVHELPEGVELVEVAGQKRGQKLQSFYDICREYQVDHVIDHYILYNNDWPIFALLAETLGIRTTGWLHNFALRPIFDFNHRMAFLQRHLPLLKRVVTLSATDVAFWKAQGIDDAVYLPNPASPWLSDRPQRTEPRQLEPGKPLRIVWWGRIQEHTKRVRSLIDVAADLEKLGVEFELSIIGPDSKDLTAEELRESAELLEVGHRVDLPGPMHGDELMVELERADLYVSTSAIEGYPLTLIEAQALGLPVAMYALPWLAVREGNHGLAEAPQGDSRGLAETIAALASDSERYESLSRGSLKAASVALSHNFTSLYRDLLSGGLAEEYSPDPDQETLNLLLDRAMAFHEGNVSREKRYAGRLKGDLKTVGDDRKRLKSVALGLRAEVRELKKERSRLKSVALDLRAENRKLHKERGQLKRELDALMEESDRGQPELQGSVAERLKRVYARASRKV